MYIIMRSLFFILSTLLLVNGFKFSSKPDMLNTQLFSKVIDVTSDSDVEETVNKDTFKFVGDTPPLGLFDPLGFLKNAEERKVRKFREAELHHGRIAMVSSLILPALDVVTKQPGINALRLSDSKTQLIALLFFAMYEGNRILKLYDSPFNEKTQFKLKPDSLPGQYFNTKDYSEQLMNKELNNGRLAMIGVAGYIAQEFVTGQPIF